MLITNKQVRPDEFISIEQENLHKSRLLRGALVDFPTISFICKNHKHHYIGIKLDATIWNWNEQHLLNNNFGAADAKGKGTAVERRKRRL